MQRTRDVAFPVAAFVRPLATDELLRWRGGGDHEDPWLWQLFPWGPPTGPIDILTGTGPTCPPPPASPV